MISDDKSATSTGESEKPKTALRIKFEPGELARINSRDDIHSELTADDGRKDDIPNITAVSSEGTAKPSAGDQKKVENVTTLPEVGDEIEESFEQNEATNGADRIKEAVRSLFNCILFQILFKNI